MQEPLAGYFLRAHVRAYSTLSSSSANLTVCACNCAPAAFLPGRGGKNCAPAPERHLRGAPCNERLRCALGNATLWTDAPEGHIALKRATCTG